MGFTIVKAEPAVVVLTSEIEKMTQGSLKKNLVTTTLSLGVSAAVFASITDELKKDGKVQLIGFGTFAVKVRPAREGRNPSTNTKITIPAAKVPTFKAGAALKDAVK